MEPLSDSAVPSVCHLMVETMPIPAIVYDENLIAYANPSMRELLKADSEDQVVGRSLLDFVHPEAHAGVRERTRIVRDQEAHLRHVENRILTCDGKAITVRFCVFPLRLGDQRMVGAFIEDWDD